MRFRILGTVATLALMAPAVANAAYPHVVAAGESLSSVAAADGLTVSELAAENGVSADTQLVAGSTLLIPPQSAGAGTASTAGSSTASPVSTTVTDDGDGDSDGATSAQAASSSATGGYVVAPGDTLSAIAARSGISVSALAAANGLDPNGLLPSGRSLSIPTGASTTTMASTTPSAAAPAVVSGGQVGPPYPTGEQVSGSEVGSIGSATGVSPALTQAIGWQESGFNNDLVSSTGAVGVMQIEPGTWNWIQRTLTAGTALSPSSATDNVRAGALYLHSLLAATGGDPGLAAAGYYQGLDSVRAHGMYSDTKQYVGSVMSLFQHFGGG